LRETIGAEPESAADKHERQFNGELDKLQEQAEDEETADDE